MRGRPKPTEQKLREGNPGHRPLPEPVLVGGRPELAELAEPPAELTHDDDRAWWVEVAPQLIDGGVMDRVDRTFVLETARTYGRLQRLHRVEQKLGAFDSGSRGQIRLTPWSREIRELTLAYMRMTEYLGMNPVARARLGLAHLQGRHLLAEMDRELGGGAIDGEATVPSSSDEVGLPGV